ncbi:hypothetical protein ACIF6H_35190 [Streptomyces microflavus]
MTEGPWPRSIGAPIADREVWLSVRTALQSSPSSRSCSRTAIARR